MNRIFVLFGLVLVATGAFLLLSMTGSSTTSGGGKVLHLAIDTDPKTLDPIGITDTISDGVARKVHNMLVRFDNKLDVQPDLAESYTLSPDAKTYTFTCLLYTSDAADE